MADLRQLQVHGDALEDAWRQLASLGDRAKKVASEHGLSAVKAAAKEAAGAAIPFFGMVEWVGQVLGGTAKKKMADHRRLADTYEIGATGSDTDLVAETAVWVRRLARPGFPVAVLVEDLHKADDELVNLLSDLLRGEEGGILIISTTWPGEATERGGPVQSVLEAVPAERRIRVNHDQPAPAPLPAEANLGELPLQALVDIVRNVYPNADQSTVELLADRFRNPLALEIVLGLGRIRRRADDGVLRLEPADVAEIPQAVEDLYRVVWWELPPPVRSTSILAALGIPMSISEIHAFGDDRWDQQLVSDVIDRLLPEPDAELMKKTLREAPTAYAWAREVDDLLRRFHEPVQREVALSYKDEFDTRQVRRVLGTLIGLSRDASEEARLHGARLLWALHQEGFIDANRQLIRAGNLILNSLTYMPGDLPIKIGLASSVLRLAHSLGTPADDQSVMTTRLWLASWLGEAGRVEEAITAYEALLSDQKPILGDDHRDTLTTRGNLALLLGEAGRVKEAITAFEELLGDECDILGHDHPDTLTTRSNLASWLGEAGRVDEAITAYEELLGHECDILGDDHPDTLTTRSNLASWLTDAGRVKEAITAYEELLGDRRRILGDDHPDTLRTRSNLASVLGRSGRVDEAITAHEELLGDRRRLLGDDHPDTLTIRSNLAYWLGDAGRVDEAITAFEELLGDERHILGDDHPHTLTTRSNLASLLGEAGRVKEAITAFEELLSDQRPILGDDHPHTLTARSNLASLLGDAGRIEEAITAYEELLGDRRRIFGDDHRDTVTTRRKLDYLIGDGGPS